MRNDGSRPSRSSTKAIIAVVVVLPCAPATTMESARPTSSATSWARDAPSTRPAKAVETKASASAGASGGPSEISTGIPAARTPSRYGVSRRSHPLTSAPHALRQDPVAAHPGAADSRQPDLPAAKRQGAGAPSRCRRRHAGARGTSSPHPSVCRRSGSARSSSTCRRRSSSGSGTTTAPPPRSK